MPSTGSRTPRGSLSRDRIVDVALDLVRGDTADSLTMQRLAAALDTSPMSLYSHVDGRDDLMDAIAGRAFGDWTVDVESDAPWEELVGTWCRSLRDQVRQYPSLVTEVARQGKFHPALLANVAELSRGLRRAGVDGRDLAGLLRWIPQTALGAVVLELSRPRDLRSAGDESAAVYASIGALDPDDRDELADLLIHLTGDETGDELFEYTIERLVDGIRAVAGPDPGATP